MYLLRAPSEVTSSMVINHCGDGPLRLMLQRESERLGIAPRIRWAGSVKRPSVLTTADLFCMPSLHEGQG